MIKTPAYAVASAISPLAPVIIERREPGPHDILIDILYCGVCHSDIHQARDEWGGAIFPMVPGHEIIGIVSQTGSLVSRWKVGDTIGVGCFVDSCRQCEACEAGEEQYCRRGASFTYNSQEQDGQTPTYGGYSTRITVDESYIVRVPDGIPPERAAPCSARALPLIRRCAALAFAPATGSRSSGLVDWDTWASSSARLSAHM